MNNAHRAALLVSVMGGGGVAAPAGCSALSVTEAFTDANGTLIQNHGTSWTIAKGSLAINTNALAPNADSLYSAAFWNANPFYADQYAQAVLAATFFAGNEYIGVAVRVTVNNFYGLFVAWNGSNSFMVKVVAGAETFMTGDLGAWTANDVMKITAVETTITAYKNGVSVGSVVDTSLATGAAGVCSLDGISATPRIDTWEGGNICP